MLEKERETAEKVAAWAFTQHYLADLLASMYTMLGDHGYFYDPVKKGVAALYYWQELQLAHLLFQWVTLLLNTIKYVFSSEDLHTSNPLFGSST